MSENTANINKRRFLSRWAFLNFLGYMIGSIIVFQVSIHLEYYYEFSASRIFAIWLPMGASVGLFQWLRLKKLGVRFVEWIAVTVLGFSTFFTLYNWVFNFGSFDYREYNIPNWLINFGLGLAVIVGGVIIGSLQSIVIRKFISNTRSWVSAYAIWLFLAFVMGLLSFTFKSIFLNTLYFFNLYGLALGPLKYFLLYTFLILVTVIGSSVQTGKELFAQLYLSSGSKAG